MFKATIKDHEARQIWCRAITLLSSISDTLRIVLCSSAMGISALSHAKTASLEVLYLHTFFDSYIFSLAGDTIKEGFTYPPDCPEDPELATFSFLINAKYLLALFKGAENDNSFTLKVNFSRNVSRTQLYRLHVERTSLKNVKKLFAPGFQPCEMATERHWDVSSSYKTRLSQLWSEYKYEATSDPFRMPYEAVDERIKDPESSPMCYLELDNIALRPFLDKALGGMEDFQFDVRTLVDRLYFIAFLKAVKKDRLYLKQPLALFMTMELSSLTASHFHGPTDVKITVRLKELRVFAGLTSMDIVSHNAAENRQTREFSHATAGTSNLFEVFFVGNGLPVIFEGHLKGNQVRVRLTQVTDSDSIDVKLEGGTKKATRPAVNLQDYRVVRKKESQKIESNNDNDNHGNNNNNDINNNISGDEVNEPLFVDQSRLISAHNESLRLRGKSNTIALDYETTEERDEIKAQEASQETITWNAGETLLLSRTKRVFEEEEDQQEEEDGIERTQNVKRAKGLFD